MRAPSLRRGFALPLLGMLVGCEREPKPPPPDSLAALEAEFPPHTKTCQAWDEAALANLAPLAGGPHVQAFDRVWRTVAEKHYDPTLACLDWIALREHYAPKVVEAGTDAAAAYVLINELLGLLGQSHLHATAPFADVVADFETGPATVPIVVRWLPVEPGSDKRVIVVVDEAVDDHASGIPRGAILTSVGGQPLDELIEKTAKAVTDRGGRPTEAAFLVARMVGARLSCPADGKKAIGYLDPSKADAPAELEVACFVPEGERMSLGNLRDLPTTVEARLIEPAAAEPAVEPAAAAPIGYLAFNFWMLPMAPQIQSGVEGLRASGMAGLIIDLRGNPGGVGSMSIPVARLLLREAASLGRLQMREFDQEFKVEANPDAFAGPIAVLVDEGTASTSEIFALGMRDIGRVSIVGAGPSAGMALPSMIEELPDGGMIQYVVGDYHSGKGKAAEGSGVIPELLVPESRADFVAGRDPVLDAAVELLRGKLSEPAPTPEPKPAE